LVDDGISNEKLRYYRHKGIIYREFAYSTVENGHEFVQLVVPKTLRDKSNEASLSLAWWSFIL